MAMVREEINGKTVYIVERHHQVLEAWAEIRRGLNSVPTLLSLDRHNDTRPGFGVHLIQQDVLTLDTLIHPECVVAAVTAECAKYNYQNPASIVEAIGHLRHDEHVDAAIRLGIIGRAFIIAFDQISVAQRDAEGSFEDRCDHTYVLPRERIFNYDEMQDRYDADNSLETDWLYEKLGMMEEIAALDGDPDWRQPAFILDIDLDYFRTPKAIAPDDPMVFHAMISEARAITIALEPHCVHLAQLGAPQTAAQLLAAIKAHIQAAQAAQ
jgi:hypothetical protein